MLGGGRFQRVSSRRMFFDLLTLRKFTGGSLGYLSVRTRQSVTPVCLSKLPVRSSSVKRSPGCLPKYLVSTSLCCTVLLYLLLANLWSLVAMPAQPCLLLHALARLWRALCAGRRVMQTFYNSFGFVLVSQPVQGRTGQCDPSASRSLHCAPTKSIASGCLQMIRK